MLSPLKTLRSLMIKQDVDAVLISSAFNINYVTGYDGFSIYEREAYLLVTKKECALIVSALHYVEVKEKVVDVEVIERTPSHTLKEILKELIVREEIKSFGFEDNNLTVSEYNFFNKSFSIMLAPIDLSDLRLIKTQDEIDKIKKACKIGDNAYSHILKNLKIDMTEKEVAFELEWFIRKNNAVNSFDPVVAYGAYAAIPHHQTGDKKLTKNECVLIDFGVKYDSYCSDMTRTFFYGKASGEQKKVYETVLAAQKKAEDYIEKKLAKKEEPIASRIDGTARDYVTTHGYPPFNHSSHGIGLEVHEKPHVSSSKDPLKTGMVISIEPGIYLPDNMGVRIEDLYTIENNMLVTLTHSPKYLIEV